jgi:hypothetical protein
VLDIGAGCAKAFVGHDPSIACYVVEPDSLLAVSDEQAVAAARRLAKEEGLFSPGSAPAPTLPPPSGSSPGRTAAGPASSSSTTPAWST